MRIFRSAIKSITQNKLRSFLAGFGIAWGIFLLVVFLGIGGGFRDGVMSLFNAFAQKSLFVYAGQTSVDGDKLNKGTQLYFDRNIVDKVRSRYGSIKYCSVEMVSPSVGVSWNGELVSATVEGVDADYFKIRILKIKDGRDISPMDDFRSREVVVIGDGIQQTLFGKQEAIGQMITIEGVSFMVIGVLSSDDLFSVRERNSIYVPASSFVDNFNTGNQIQSFCFSLSQNGDPSRIDDDLKGYLAHLYGFDPHDEQAVYIDSIETQVAAFESLFRGLEILIWIVGVCLLLSGIVGVCNVMLIIVKERTNEIGIRKAVGAPSGSIISMIIAESVTITVVSGIIGITLGGLLVLLANKIVVPMLGTDIIEKLDINFPAVLVAFAVLCLSGVAAGLFPALKASQISPVDAIRYENRG